LPKFFIFARFYFFELLEFFEKHNSLYETARILANHAYWLYIRIFQTKAE